MIVKDFFFGKCRWCCQVNCQYSIHLPSSLCSVIYKQKMLFWSLSAWTPAYLSCGSERCLAPLGSLNTVHRSFYLIFDTGMYVGKIHNDLGDICLTLLICIKLFCSDQSYYKISVIRLFVCLQVITCFPIFGPERTC